MIASEHHSQTGLQGKASQHGLKKSVADQLQKPPTAAELNTLSAKFNQGKIADSELIALDMTQRYPQHGFAWKVLGVIYQQQGLMEEAFIVLKKAAELLPKDSEAHYNLANFYYDNYQLSDAIRSYRQAIILTPSFVNAHYNLGSVYKDQGLLAEAEASYKKALKLNPKNAQMHFNLGIMLNDQGRFSEAEACYKSAVKCDASYVDAHYNLANLLHKSGKLAEAKIAYLKALAINPNLANAQNNLGNLLKDLEDFIGAEACYRKAIALTPEYAGHYNNLGLVLKEQARFSEAEASYRHALVLSPNAVDTLNNLGIILKDQGLLVEAVATFEQALVIRPNFVDANVNLGMAFRALRDYVKAEECIRTALQEKPNFSEAYSSLGVVFKDQERWTEAEQNFLRAIEISPNFFQAYNNLGSTYLCQSRLTEAEACLRKALELKPDYLHSLSNLLFCLSHNTNTDAQDLFAEHRKFGEQLEAPFKKTWPQHTNQKDPERTLRIGFVSGDFRNHAVAYFIEPVLQALAGYATLSLYAYSTATIYDDISERLSKSFAQWASTPNLSEADLAAKIQADGIDILIDLSGHTAGHRLPSFARKPAPIQASWIGYPGTTGLMAMDYYLADRFLLPPKVMDNQFTEKLVQLPANAPFLPENNSPVVNTLPALRNGYITFGSFNRPSKLSQSVVVLWAQVLRAVPNAKMLLGAMPKDGFIETLQTWFANEGIAPERLMLHLRSDMTHYLHLHHEVDICLDTFPYNGGTTTLHAVWMGVPTLTIAGDMMQSRVGASVMGQVGLDDFVVANQAEFLQQAIFWANNLNALANLRASMRTRFMQSPVGQPALIAQGLERALRTMWQRWCNGLTAESFQVELPNTEIKSTSQQLAADIKTSVSEVLTINQALDQAMNEVFQMALEQQHAGQIEQAAQLYLEILNIQPKHAEANHQLGLIEASLHGASIALPRLEIAVIVKPEIEQFWVSYIDALMQSGMVETVVDVLRIGQQYGLSAQTAQMLEEDFGVEVVLD